MALADYDEAIALDPKLAVAPDNRGELYLVKDDPDRAISELDAALKLDPSASGSLCRRAMATAKMGGQSGPAVDLAAAEAIRPRIELERRQITSP